MAETGSRTVTSSANGRFFEGLYFWKGYIDPAALTSLSFPANLGQVLFLKFSGICFSLHKKWICCSMFAVWGTPIKHRHHLFTRRNQFPVLVLLLTCIGLETLIQNANDGISVNVKKNPGFRRDFGFSSQFPNT